MAQTETIDKGIGVRIMQVARTPTIQITCQAIFAVGSKNHCLKTYAFISQNMIGVP